MSGITSASDLADTVCTLHQEGLEMGKTGLAYAYETEGYIQQSYEGRSLFELIQNARDANQLQGKAGCIWFSLQGGILRVANTGAAFTREGIRAVAHVGESTKHSAETIGFKGIGFKSVRQLTDQPRVVTQHGTVYFDVAETRRRHPERVGARCPLFLLPYYADTPLSSAELAQGIVTRLELPLRDELAVQWVHRNFEDLKIEQLLLLDWLEEVSFTTDGGKSRHYRLEKGQRARELKTQVDDQPEQYFQVYSPEIPVTIPPEIVAGLGEKEKALVSTMQQVDIRVVLGADAAGGHRPLTQASLYLFYPLGLKTGFSFLIHSYFLVSPSRTELRPDAQLNTFLLQAIGRFIGTELLQQLRQLHWDTSEVLRYNHNEGSGEKLRVLYKSVRDTLRDKAFVYCAGAYLHPAEVITIGPSLSNRLPLSHFAGKRLVVASDKVREWLSSEFEVRELSRRNLETELEQECARRQAQQDWPFFEQLYSFLSTRDAPDMTGRAVLLTQHQQLVAGKQVNIFYIDRRQPRSLELPVELADAVQVLNERFTFTGETLRFLQGRTGLRDFERASLAKALLDRMGPQKSLNWELLNVLYNLREEVSPETFQSEGILPTTDSQWVNPLHTPVYLNSPELRALYAPRGSFLDEAIFARLGLVETAAQHAFLQWAGVWQRPGLYVQRSERQLDEEDSRYPQLGWENQHTRRTIWLQRERQLAVPARISSWFGAQLLAHWESYRNFLQKDIVGNSPSYTQNGSYPRFINSSERIALSGAMQWLREKAWLQTQQDANDDTYRPAAEVVLISRQENASALDRAVVSYLPTVAVPGAYLEQLASDLQAATWPAATGEQFTHVLKLFYEHNNQRLPELRASEAEKLKKAYSQVLTRLYEATLGRGLDLPAGLAGIRFLAVDTRTAALSWCQGALIYYVDDLALYDQLPDKWQAVVQPQFTRTEAHQFGKIAQQVGTCLSEMLDYEVQHGEITRQLTLSKLLGEQLGGCLALLEQKLEESLTDQEVATLAELRVLEVQSLRKVLWWLDDTQNTHAVELPHFAGTHREETYAALYVTTGFGQQPAEVAAALTQAAQVLLAKDEVNWVDAQATLSDYLESERPGEFLNRRRIGRSRLLELEQQLQTTGDNLVAFWRAVRRATGAAPLADAATLEALTADLPLSEGLRAQFAPASFRYGNLSDASNRKALQALVKALGLPFATLQQAVAEPLSVEELWGNEWSKLRNRYQAAFQAWQYERVAAPDATSSQLKRQQNFSRLLDTYRLLPPRPYPAELAEPLENHFERVLVDKFPELAGLSVLKKQPEHPAQWYNDEYRQTLLAVQQQVAAPEHAWLNEFIAGSQLRDLLFFGQTEPILTAYETWAAPQRGPTEAEAVEANAAATEAARPDPYANPTSVFAGAATMRAAPVGAPRLGTERPSGGSGASGAAHGERESYIGRRAEQRVLGWLATRYTQVSWVSFNAKAVGIGDPWYNPDGDDRVGYDITYWDDELGEKVLVEVKGTTGDGGRLYISRKEVEVAGQAANAYRLLYVTQVEEAESAQIHDLGNPFSQGLKGLHDNPAFTPIWEKMQLAFTLNGPNGEQE